MRPGCTPEVSLYCFFRVIRVNQSYQATRKDQPLYGAGFELVLRYDDKNPLLTQGITDNLRSAVVRYILVSQVSVGSVLLDSGYGIPGCENPLVQIQLLGWWH